MTDHKKKWKAFGWHGITLEIPPDWTLGGISGNAEEGYLRIDDEEMPRMEIKWRKNDKGTPSLSDIIDNYVDDLEKTVEQKDVHIYTKRDFDHTKFVKSLPNKEIRGFFWKSSTKAYGIASYCTECRRIVILQIVSKVEQDVNYEISRVFSSFEDHAIDGNNLWALYDMNFKIPTEFALKEQELLPGYLKFSFSRGDEAFPLNVERWGLTDVVLKNGSITIKEWFEEKNQDLIRSHSIQLEEAEFNGHKGYKFQGVKKSSLTNIRDAFERLTRAQTPNCVHGAFWHCKETKKIYVITMQAQEFMNAVVEYVTSQIKCHQPGDVIEENNMVKRIKRL